MARATSPLTLPTGAIAAARAVLARPTLWRPAARQARAMVPSGWWRRRPFLPVPDRAWLEFRMTTAYGDPAAPLVADDVTEWLAWSDTVAVHGSRAETTEA